MRPRAQIALVIACGAIAGGTVVAGCDSGDSDTAAAEATSSGMDSTAASPSSGGAAESTETIDIADFKYDPETVTVKAGAELTWTNSDAAAHTATADDSSFDTGDLDKGDSKSVTFDNAGSFTYYCRFHPFMKATVEVQ
jgi:plastocyanin